MNWRMTTGNDERPQSRAYTEGYNTGYNMAMDEMARQRRDDHIEEPMNRRGRPRGTVEDNVLPSPERLYAADNGTARQIGFTGRADDGEGSMMAMLKALKEGQEHIKKGLAETHKKLDPHMEGLLESAVKVLDNPPSTWAPYKEKDDFMGIARMEGRELLEALEDGKPLKSIRKELTHTIAALLQMVSE